MKAITNTTVISNFANIKQLDVLRQLHQVIYISVEVYEEIQTGLEEGYEFYASIDEQIYPLETGWIKLTSNRAARITQCRWELVYPIR
jgi:predicted nucleic acid-binding protein